MVSSLNIRDVCGPWKFVKLAFIKLKTIAQEFKPPHLLSISMLPPWRQYSLALAVFVLVTTLSFWIRPWFGYQAIALIYLLSVVLLALVINRGATLAAHY